MRARKLFVILAALSLLGARAAAAEPATLLPEVSVHLQAARYVPSETELRWTGWIGAGAGLVKVNRTTVYFTADVETLIGNERRSFDANQANYHLELGARHEQGTLSLTPFFHHVSRHAIDRDKPEAVDWNVLGLRVARSFAVRRLSSHVWLSAGHTTLTSLVGYRWEITAGAHVRSRGLPYARLELRAVTAEPSETFPQRLFADVLAEGGAHWQRGARSLETFAAFERRHDVYLTRPGVKYRLLLGFRIAFSG